jgi:hypothetical protein
VERQEVVCSTCGVPKDESEFYTRKGKRHGRQCKKCLNTRQIAYHQSNRQAHLVAQRRANRNLKLLVLRHYGSECYCCGESDDRFLTLDHIDGNGKEHRTQVKRQSSGSYFYRWVRDQGFPPLFQVACFNCNVGRHWNGGVCPHQEKAKDSTPTSLDWQTVHHVSGLLAVSVRTLRRWNRQGRLPGRTQPRSSGGRPVLHVRASDVRTLLR